MSSREGGRTIKLEVRGRGRGLSETRYMLMYIDDWMKSVGDTDISLVFMSPTLDDWMKSVGDIITKLMSVCDDIKMTDELKIYRDMYLLPNNENINMINNGDEIIVYRNRKATEIENVDYGADVHDLEEEEIVALMRNVS